MSDKKIFDPDDDPAQVEAARKAAAASAERTNILAEDDVALRAAIKAEGGEAPVPRDAATLILYKRLPDGPRILMGCRSEGHDFMPNKFVFPGGRVDEDDEIAPALSELSDQVASDIAKNATRAPRAFPLTAVREVFEETGLIVGRPGQFANVPPSWADYYAQGAAPCLANFQFLGHAITPPMRHKRFDARFFMADAADALIDDRPPIDGRELNNLRWFTLAEAAQLDVPNVTRFVISEIEARLVHEEPLRPFHLYWTAEGHRKERV